MKSKRLIKNAEAKTKEQISATKSAIYFSVQSLKKKAKTLKEENIALKAKIAELEKENKELEDKIFWLKVDADKDNWAPGSFK